MSLDLRAVMIDRGGRVLARDLDLTVERGEILGVLGPNGAGKSTLLAVLAGILGPSAGQVLWSGADLRALDPPARARAIGYAPQTVEPAWGIPVAAMLDAALQARGIAGTLAEEHRAEALAAFDLDALAGRPITALSGGETKRLSLAVAAVGRPAVLLLDEPFAGLDIAHRLRLAATARTIAGTGRAVVTSLHEIPDAIALCARVLVLDGQGGAALGPTGDILSPARVSSIWGIRAERDEHGAMRFALNDNGKE